MVAYAIETLGLEKGSAIAIDMPMDVNSVVIYLAIVLAGYVVVSIADSFAPSEISSRLKISKAKAIFTQVSAIYSYQEHQKLLLLLFFIFLFFLCLNSILSVFIYVVS